MPKPKSERKAGAAKPAAETMAPAAKREGLRKKDLIDRVVQASGAKPGDVKKVVEATLALLAEHIGREDALALAPLGKLSVAKRKATPKGEILTLKLRRGGAEKTAKEPLAARDE